MTKLYNATVTALIVLGIVASVAAWTGCQQLKSAAQEGKALVVDCTKAEAVRAITELGPLVEETLIDAILPDAKVTLDPLKSAAQRWTADIGGCILADIVARAQREPDSDPAAPKSSTLTPLQTHRDDLRKAFDEFKAARFSGVTFQLANGARL